MWIAEGNLDVAAHDLYFTTGETVGTADARFPSGGFEWNHIRPPVSLEHWTFAAEPPERGFTTVSSWWSDEWACDGGEWYDNSKRASFIGYLDLPRAVPVAPRARVERRRERGGGSRAARAARLARPAAPRRSRRRPLIPRLRPGLGRRVQLRQAVVHAAAELVGQRSHDLLSGKRPAGRRPGHRPEPIPRRRRGVAALLHARRGAAAALYEVHAHYEAHRDAARELAVAHFDARKVTEGILDPSRSGRRASAPPGPQPASTTGRSPAPRGGVPGSTFPRMVEVDELRQVRFLEPLKDRALKRLAEGMTERTAPEGEDFVTQGSRASRSSSCSRVSCR